MDQGSDLMIHFLFTRCNSFGLTSSSIYNDYMSKYLILIGLLFLFFCQAITAQEKQDSIATEKLLSSALKNVYNDPEQTRNIVLENLNAYLLSNYFISKSLNHVGIAYDVMGNNDSALIYYDSALLIAEQHGLVKMQAGIHNNIGLIYWKKGKYELAIEQYDFGLANYSKLNDTLGIANSLNNMGLIYQKMNQYNLGLKSFRQASENYQQIDNKRGLSAAYMNIGTVKDLINEFDSSFYYFKKSIDLKIEIEDKYGLGIVYSDYAKLYAKTDQCDSAIRYDKKALKLFNELNNAYHVSQVTYDLGKNWMCLNQLDSAELYLRQAEEMALQGQNNFTLKHIYYQLMQLYEIQQNWPDAFLASQQFLAYKDSLFSKDIADAVFDVQEKYETEKKNKELAEKSVLIAQQDADLARSELENNRKNFWLFALGIGIVGFVILIFLIRKQAKTRREKLIQERDLKEKEEKLRISKELHDNIGARLSHIISSLDIEMYKNNASEEIANVNAFARETIVELRETIWAVSEKAIHLSELKSRIENYIHQVANLSKCEMVYDDSSKLEVELSVLQTINVFRIVQEAINNAVKYSGSQRVNISVKDESNGVVVFNVQDFGKGFDQEMTKNLGNGIVNMRTRALEVGGNIEIKTNPDQGTFIQLFVNLE